jgi:hypothetical protein
LVISRHLGGISKIPPLPSRGLSESGMLFSLIVLYQLNNFKDFAVKSAQIYSERKPDVKRESLEMLR